MSGNRVAPFSWANNTPSGLIAGVALQTPNPDLTAVPIPEPIEFLYNLPRCQFQDLDPQETCPICLEEFDMNGSHCEVDIFKEDPEVPLLTPCGHVVGSKCLWIQLSPLEPIQGNQCCLCRHEFFEAQQLSETPAGIDRSLQVMAWVIQECNRRLLVEGSEEGKQHARDTIALMERSMAEREQLRARMVTGHLEEYDRITQSFAERLAGFRAEVERHEELGPDEPVSRRTRGEIRRSAGRLASPRLLRGSRTRQTEFDEEVNSFREQMNILQVYLTRIEQVVSPTGQVAELGNRLAMLQDHLMRNRRYRGQAQVATSGTEEIDTLTERHTRPRADLMMTATDLEREVTEEISAQFVGVVSEISRMGNELTLMTDELSRSRQMGDDERGR